MKHPFSTLLALLVLALAAGAAAAEEPEAPAAEAAPMEFESFQLVLLKRPAAPAEHPPEKLAEI